jgi:hypothetical protein
MIIFQWVVVTLDIGDRIGNFPPYFSWIAPDYCHFREPKIGNQKPRELLAWIAA